MNIHHLTTKQRQFFADFGKALAKRLSIKPSDYNLENVDDQASKDFAEYIRASRTALGWSRLELAKKAELSEADIHAIEHGLILSTQIRVDLLRKLATALDDDVEMFGLLLERDFPAECTVNILSRFSTVFHSWERYLGSKCQVFIRWDVQRNIAYLSPVLLLVLVLIFLIPEYGKKGHPVTIGEGSSRLIDNALLPADSEKKVVVEGNFADDGGSIIVGSEIDRENIVGHMERLRLRLRLRFAPKSTTNIVNHETAGRMERLKLRFAPKSTTNVVNHETASRMETLKLRFAPKSTTNVVNHETAWRMLRLRLRFAPKSTTNAVRNSEQISCAIRKGIPLSLPYVHGATTRVCP